MRPLAREVAAGEKEGSVLRPLAQELGAEGKMASEDEEAGEKEPSDDADAEA